MYYKKKIRKKLKLKYKKIEFSFNITETKGKSGVKSMQLNLNEKYSNELP